MTGSDELLEDGKHWSVACAEQEFLRSLLPEYSDGIVALIFRGQLTPISPQKIKKEERSVLVHPKEVYPSASRFLECITNLLELAVGQ